MGDIGPWGRELSYFAGHFGRFVTEFENGRAGAGGRRCLGGL